EITLLTDQVTCFSKVETINQNTDFYNKNEQDGKFYSFFGSNEDKTASNEYIFILRGNQHSKTTFTVTIFDTTIDTQQVFFCIKRL
ncbi:MAG: hypothetical protein IIX60_00160, partial [Clostridia bacterium]|nr:hypothetical protein [Clostridia bacterium]